MERQRLQQQNQEQANVWGGVAASFVGAAAGALIGEAFHSHDGCSSYDSCSSDDVGDVFDDGGFDFGDDS